MKMFLTSWVARTTFAFSLVIRSHYVDMKLPSLTLRARVENVFSLYFLASVNYFEVSCSPAKVYTSNNIVNFCFTYYPVNSS